MLRSILSKAMASRGRTTSTTPAAGRRRSVPGTATGGSANGEIARGAKSLARGLGRKRRGL